MGSTFRSWRRYEIVFELVYKMEAGGRDRSIVIPPILIGKIICNIL